MDTEALELAAATVLPPHVYDYYRATSGGPEVLSRAVDAWEAHRFRPRILRDTTHVDTTTTVLGTEVRTPVLVAPMAQQVGSDPRGEAATAEGAAAAGTLLGVSTNTAIPFERIAAPGAPWWFQVYVMQDRDVTAALLRRAVAAGARAIILTVDITGLAHPRPGAAWSVEPTDWGDVPEAARLMNLTEAERASLERGGGRYARDVGVLGIRWVADVTGLPVVVKGVLRADDARRVVAAGASGVIVSTHGSRAFASSIPSGAALREVAEAVGGAVEVYADSGLRSGAHVAAALALGARAVFVGRPVMWGLATGGAAGVTGVVDTLTAELATAMDRIGAPSLEDLTSDLLVP